MMYQDLHGEPKEKHFGMGGGGGGGGAQHSIQRQSGTTGVL